MITFIVCYAVLSLVVAVGIGIYAAFNKTIFGLKVF